MPWTRAQIGLFRAAAHNPAIAKKHGLSQADAARMSHEGVKGETKKKAKGILRGAN